MKIHSLFGLILLALAGACRDEVGGLKPLDLHPYGIDLSVRAPDSSSVQVKDYSIMRDITIRGGDDYFVQIFEFNVPVMDAAGEKLRQLTAAREDPYFKELLREDDHGFIYSKQLDSTLVDYDFRYIKIIGDKELIFQTGLVGTFTLDEVKQMYQAVK